MYMHSLSEIDANWCKHIMDQIHLRVHPVMWEVEKERESESERIVPINCHHPCIKWLCTISFEFGKL